MRRRKKLLKNLFKLLIVIAIVIGLFFMFKPKKKITTSNNTSSPKEILSTTTINEPNIEVNLPSEIKDINNSNKNITSTEKNNKTYAPLIKVSEKYLIPILSNNELTVLIGDDSQNLLPDSSPVKVGNEYTVSGIEETIISVYYFTIDNYSYPILLLLSETKKLYYVDLESAYLTGNFIVSGYIKDIPEVKNVYRTTVTENKKEYRSAIIVDINDIGYEFNTNMIGR